MDTNESFISNFSIHFLSFFLFFFLSFFFSYFIDYDLKQTEVVLGSNLCWSKSQVESFSYFIIKYHVGFFWIHFIRIKSHLLFFKCQGVLNYKWMFNCY